MLTASRLTVRAIVVAALVEAGLRAVKLPTLARVLGVGLAASAGRPAVSPGVAESARVARAARFSVALWGRKERRCLREALVMGHLLRGSQPVLRLGVARDARGVAAHAWVEVAGCAVAEDPRVLAQFTPLRAP